MDGLSIRQGQNLLDTGNTVKEMRANDLAAQKDIGIGAPADGNGSFKNVLRDAINETNALQKSADVKIQDLATGKTTNIPDVMMQVEKADIALRLMTQVRNKVIDAYQDIMKMQV
jgi:flagellar hook-basal body complex protein FliE